MSYIMFDGARTSWKTINPSSFSGEQQEEIQGTVGSKADLVAAEFREVKANASELAESALEYIQNCIEFSVEPGQVNYVSPGFVAPNITELDPTVNFVVNLSPPDSSVTGFPRVTVTDQFTFFSDTPPAAPANPFPQPALDTVTTPFVPVYIGDSYATDPGTLPDVGTVTITPISPPPQPAFDLDPINIDGTFVTPVDYTLPTNISDGAAEIIAAQAALDAVIAQTPSLPNYVVVFPQVMGFVGGLLSGFSFTQDLIDEDTARNIEFRVEFSDRVQSLWPGQTLPNEAQSVQSIWLSAEQVRQMAQQENRSNAFTALSTNEAKTLGFKLGAAAHEVQIELLIGTIKAEMEYLAATSEAMLELYRAAEASYKGAITLFESRIEQQQIPYTLESFRVQEYNIREDEKSTLSKVNRAKADFFRAQEGIKKNELDNIKAEFNRETAKLKAFDMTKRADEARTVTMKMELEQFKADLMRWGVDAKQIATQYKLWVTKAQSVQEQNTAIIKSERGQIDKYRATEEAIQAVAANTIGNLSKMQKDLVLKGTEFEEDKVKNVVEGFKDKLEGVLKARDLRSIGMDIGIRAGNLEGISAYNNQLSTYARSVSDAAYRAATQTLQANETLVKAYATAQNAAGNAQAALEAGKWSGWNVTATAKAIGNISGSFNYGSQTQRNHTNNVTQTSSERVSA